MCAQGSRGPNVIDGDISQDALHPNNAQNHSGEKKKLIQEYERQPRVSFTRTLEAELEFGGFGHHGGAPDGLDDHDNIGDFDAGDGNGCGARHLLLEHHPMPQRDAVKVILISTS